MNPEDDDFDDDFDESEPVGSCINCESDIYPFEDDGSGLCDQCQWYSVAGGASSDGD